MSPVFHRENSYCFKIYSNEEERMHIHVSRDDKEAKFWLEPEVELAENFGFKDYELTMIQKIVDKYATEFQEQFRQHVGKRVDD